VWRSGGFLQPTAPAQGVSKPVDHPAVVHLDEGSAGEGVEVREPDGKGWEIRQAAAGSARDLLEPLAREFILCLRIFHQEAQEEQRDVHEVVRVERDEREGAQRVPQRFETLAQARRVHRDHKGSRERVPILPVGVRVSAKLEAPIANEPLPHIGVFVHPYNSSR
jgi:hypothetical protein